MPGLFRFQVMIVVWGCHWILDWTHPSVLDEFQVYVVSYTYGFICFVWTLCCCWLVANWNIENRDIKSASCAKIITAVFPAHIYVANIEASNRETHQSSVGIYSLAECTHNYITMKLKSVFISKDLTFDLADMISAEWSWFLVQGTVQVREEKAALCWH